jgi:AAA family ATP:ADP antiporter
VDLLIALTERYFPHDLPLRLQVYRSLNAVRRDFPRRSIPGKWVYRRIVAEARQYDSQQQRLRVQNTLLHFTHSQKEADAREEYIALLKRRMAGTFNRLFRLLGLRYPPADVIPVHLALLSATVATQVSGIEFLDNLLELSLKRLIIPLLDRRQRHINDQVYALLPVETDLTDLRQQEFKSLRRALRSRDQRMKVVVLQLIATLEDARYLPIAAHYATDAEVPKSVRRAAIVALEALRSELAPAAV